MKKLFLKSWEFNSYIIINELKKIVLKNGGVIVSEWQKEKNKNIKIINRTFQENINSINDSIEKLKSIDALNDKQKEYLKSQEDKKNALLKYQFKNGAMLNNANYLNFVFDGEIYYLQLDENPFFDFYYSKNKINDEFEEKSKVYLVSLNKYVFYKYVASLYDFITRTTAKKIARDIFLFLQCANRCEQYKQTNTKYNIIEGSLDNGNK